MEDRTNTPLDLKRLPETPARFVEPMKARLVAKLPQGDDWLFEVRFYEWTRDGNLRQPVFLGLREDKKPAEVVRERPA